MAVIGIASTICTTRGYLYPAIRSLHHTMISSGVRSLPGLQHDDRLHLLAVRLVRHADDRDLGDGLVGHQHFFQLARVDIESAADDHVLQPVDDVEVALLVQAADVARVEPPVADRFSRRFGPLVVALHDVVAADDDLAALADGQAIVLLVDDAHLDAGDGLAHAARDAVELHVAEGGNGARFRQAIALEDGDLELGLELPDHLDGHRRAARQRRAAGCGRSPSGRDARPRRAG